MKIAILGSKGIPAHYGGFETFAEGLSTRLVKGGHEVAVTCEYVDPIKRINKFRGVKLFYFPFKPPENHFLRMCYENLSDIYFLIKVSRQFDCIYFLGIEVGLFLFIPKLLSRKLKLWVNVDGVMWKRSKFNKIEQWLLWLNHVFATLFADKIIVDSKEMISHIPERYKNKEVYISYGIDKFEQIPWDKSRLNHNKTLKSLKIEQKKYWLVVARLEPENSIHDIVKAFSNVDTDHPLIIVGDFTSKVYRKEIKKLAAETQNVFLTGSIYDQDVLNMLRQNCFAYIHGHTVGGTNPSLLEAMAMKNIVLASDNVFNREVCGNTAIYFKNSKDLTDKIGLIERNYEKYAELKSKAFKRVKSRYMWNKIFEKYDSQFIDEEKGIKNGHPEGYGVPVKSK